MEELLLWRWSTAVQITSAILVAVFFVVVGRSTGWRGVGWWVGAWVSNGVALCATWAFWVWQPGVVAMKLLLVAYLASKTLFVLLLLLGTLMLTQSLGRPPRLWRFVIPVLLYAVLGAFLMGSIDVIGLAQTIVIASFLGVAAILCWRAPGLGLGWLAVGFLLRAVLAVAEAGAYAWRMAPGDAGLPDFVGVFLASHSSFDTGAEWVIALGCVLALAHRAQAELARSHAELRATHAELQRVAERDPLTGLFNRRMLTDLLNREVADGARLLFFDLDDFKRINDNDGHNVGDACLRRFALALQEGLGDARALMRFAGDEFLAILPPQSGERIEDHIERIRAGLRTDDSGTPSLRFSVGVGALAPGGDPQVALRDADLAMYQDKARRRVAVA